LSVGNNLQLNLEKEGRSNTSGEKPLCRTLIPPGSQRIFSCPYLTWALGTIKFSWTLCGTWDSSLFCFFLLPYRHYLCSPLLFFLFYQIFKHLGPSCPLPPYCLPSQWFSTRADVEDIWQCLEVSLAVTMKGGPTGILLIQGSHPPSCPAGDYLVTNANSAKAENLYLTLLTSSNDYKYSSHSDEPPPLPNLMCTSRPGLSSEVWAHPFTWTVKQHYLVTS
jgi:hypothetical protein